MIAATGHTRRHLGTVDAGYLRAQADRMGKTLERRHTPAGDLLVLVLGDPVTGSELVAAAEAVGA